MVIRCYQKDNTDVIMDGLIIKSHENSGEGNEGGGGGGGNDDIKLPELGRFSTTYPHPVSINPPLMHKAKILITKASSLLTDRQTDNIE